MTEVDSAAEDSRALLQQLRQKEGNWVAWGRACQQLQKAGYAPQQIFEETGFEPIHQNQIIVAAQVYSTLADLPEAARTRFDRSGSDILYEFRILSQDRRAAAVVLAAEKQLDSLQAREVARAIQEYSRRREPPQGFGPEAGDAVAYRYWNLARGKKDLAERSRAIAEALKFAVSEGARRKIEALLADFTVVPTQPAPIVPFYRLESTDELPCLLPLLPSLEVAAQQLADCPAPQTIAGDPFQALTIPASPSATAWVGLPGWSSLRGAVSPVAIACTSEAFPGTEPPVEPALAVIDRGVTDWTPRAYFAIVCEGAIAFEWFAEAPDPARVELLGRLVVVLRPPKVLESGLVIGDDWDMNE